MFKAAFLLQGIKEMTVALIVMMEMRFLMSSIYSSGNESCSSESFSGGEMCSSGDTSSSDDELPNSEDEQFINDTDDDDEGPGEDSGSDACQTS